MAGRPIFVATHPRSCSTAFERVFMTRTEDVACAHEPFGDAYYYGPEHLSERFAEDVKYRERSGHANTTYKDVLDRLLNQDKRVFIKDMAYYLYPPEGKPASIVPSLASQASGVDGGGADSDSSDPNHTILPLSALKSFHFTFLIRHPRRSIPSLYRCTVPPLVQVTQFHEFMPSEAGYAELRRLFDYLRAQGLVGDKTNSNGTNGVSGVNGHANAPVAITVIDADDLLDRPAEGIQAFCHAVNLDYRPEMLQWADPASQKHAAEVFEKWVGFHDDALASTGLKARTSPKKTPTAEEENQEWTEKYGEKGQKIIRECVDANTADYEYLKQFAMKF